MVLLQVENITKSFGDLVLFENLSFSIHKNQKVAILARNGTGKTTLLNIIAGADTADSGKITLRNGISLGYLSQAFNLDNDKTIFEEIYSSSSEIIQIIREYEEALHSDDRKKLDIAISRMETAQAWDHEVKIHQLIAELQLPDANLKTGTLSGGQKKRVALANLFINEPDIIILDEPTNHLDLDIIVWLEEYLLRSNCTLLMVTHDRYFLDRVCNEILELDDKTLYQYKGNYSYFLEKRDERIEVHNAEVEKARNLLRTELEWIRRMPKARTTKAKYRVEAFSELEEKASKSKIEKNVEINVSAARLGNKILEISDLSKAYGDKLLLKDFTYMFRRFEKIGIIGKNGSGKTTFLNLINGLVKPDTGHFEYGETVVSGYYKQEDHYFKEGKKVIDIVKDIAEVVSPENRVKMSVSQFLGYFLFPPKVQQTPVEKLSGGERRRLHLVTILMKNPNFLILDEPTNDLDIVTLNVLEEYLKNFPGCIVVVSHDRFFLDKLADHIFVFDGKGKIKDFPGNYSDYNEWLKKQPKSISTTAENKTSVKKENKQSGADVSEKSRRLTWKEKKELEELFLSIEKLTNERKSIEEKLSGGITDSRELTELSKRLNEVINLTDIQELRWLELSEIGS